MSIQIQIRRDTTANWNSVDPVLAEGELGYDLTEEKFKVGNGTTAWSGLGYSSSTGGGGDYLPAEYNENFTWPDLTGSNVPFQDVYTTPSTYANNSFADKVWTTDLEVSDKQIRTNLGLSASWTNGVVQSASVMCVENRVFGGINITGAEADRPEELPLSDFSNARSIQYALTVTHETLGRTVEIDKEGIIRAHQFTDMEGNPIGGGGSVDLTGYATESWVSTNYQPKGSYLVSSDLNGYATESWVNGQGFAKGDFVPKSGNTTISGTLTATDFVATSDERLKQNVTTAPVGLVDQLRGVEFEWKEDGRQDSGVIAQEVEKVLPHLVHDTGEHKAVNYNGLVAYLIEEVKALRAEVEALK